MKGAYINFMVLPNNVLNSVFLNWSDLDEGTKIIILGMSALGLIMYSYNKKDINLIPDIY